MHLNELPPESFSADLCHDDAPSLFLQFETEAGSGNSNVWLGSTGGEVVAMTFENAAASGALASMLARLQFYCNIYTLAGGKKKHQKKKKLAVGGTLAMD